MTSWINWRAANLIRSVAVSLLVRQPEESQNVWRGWPICASQGPHRVLHWYTFSPELQVAYKMLLCRLDMNAVLIQILLSRIMVPYRFQEHMQENSHSLIKRSQKKGIKTYIFKQGGNICVDQPVLIPRWDTFLFCSKGKHVRSFTLHKFWSPEGKCEGLLATTKIFNSERC